MINDLLTAMSLDMGISRFHSESMDSFTYRLCYSALGQWCLHTALNSSGGVNGATKHNQTIILNDLVARFSELFPSVTNRFVDTVNRQINLSVHIRRIYEETGYFLTNKDNRNQVANYGRSITIGNSALFFGLPNKAYTVNGLGMFTNLAAYKVLTKEFLIRDDLTCEEYLRSRFDPIDFDDKGIDVNDLEFFNPQTNNVPSQSWGKRLETEFTIARKSETGPFYRVMQVENTIQFADESIEQQNDSFTSYEYRRLYFALKSHYKTPLKATITRQDNKYSTIRVRGHLPNREYYFLLLLSWPENNAFDKVNFIVRNDFISEVTAVLTKIGIEVKGGHTNV
jgi:hypothetical protein